MAKGLGMYDVKSKLLWPEGVDDGSLHVLLNNTCT